MLSSSVSSDPAGTHAACAMTAATISQSANAVHDNKPGMFLGLFQGFKNEVFLEAMISMPQRHVHAVEDASATRLSLQGLHCVSGMSSIHAVVKLLDCGQFPSCWLTITFQDSIVGIDPSALESRLECLTFLDLAASYDFLSSKFHTCVPVIHFLSLRGCHGPWRWCKSTI